MSVPVVAIIGAGYAGLACAVELARAGVHVTVFERSHTLGGRARVVHKGGHWRVDNGQHILISSSLTSPRPTTRCSTRRSKAWCCSPSIRARCAPAHRAR